MKRKNFLRMIPLGFAFLGLLIGVYLVQRAVRYFSGASGAFSNIVVDMESDYGTASDAWRNLAQGGETRDRWLLPVSTQVKALRPEYIRIDHVFDYYNQGELDNIIRDIQAVGAKPFIALSYMPPAISKTGSVTDYPKDWAEWEKTVQNLIQHVSGRNGLAITGVYYEVWNEPDLFGDFKMYGPKNYLKLYSHTAIAASRATNTLPYKFGGPATTGYYPNWMNGLLSYASKNKLRLDFLSWHKYSKNMADYEADTANARTLLAKYKMSGREMVITEIGPNGAVDPVYDSNFGAIHLLATSIVLQNEVTKTFTFEIKDGPGEKQYWGRWGLYTHEKFGAPVAKPRAKAFAYLNYMVGGSKMGVFGQGSWVRAMGKKFTNQTARLLLVNYDPRGIHSEEVPVKFANLRSQNFTLKKISFLGTTTSEDISVEGTEYDTKLYMKPNSAVILEITYK